MSGLSYCAPAGGSWNLAHICRLLPGSHTLFVTPAGCARIIALSAIERGLQGRFSILRIEEHELIAGGLEERTLEAARTILQEQKPGALFVFTSCVSDFIGVDRDVYLQALQAEFPDTPILDGRMDPINRNGGMPPIVRMQKLLASCLQGGEPRQSVLVTGSFWPPEDGQELLEHLKAHGFEIVHAYRCRTMAEYRDMGRSRLNLVLHPTAVAAAKDLEARLGMPWVNLASGTPEEHYRTVCDLLGIDPPDTSAAQQACRETADRLLQVLDGRAVDLDDGYCADPLALAAQLTAQGIPVRRIFMDNAGGKAVPEGATVIEADAPERALSYQTKEFYDPDAVCAGEYAAYAAHSGHFCSGLRFTGRFGHHGLRRTMEDLITAAQNDKPLTAVTGSGRGCFGL